MAIIICISDYQLKRKYLQITANNNIAAVRTLREATDAKALRRLQLFVDGISAFYIIREIEEFTQYRQRLCTNPALRGLQLLWIQITQPEREIIDFKWNDMLAHTLWERIEADYLMSWLSTLGGGYSALGEQFSKCAETAGKISLKQLSIGLRLGDPFLQARCMLYYSISLIQTGRLRAAKHIVRAQYQFASRHREHDTRLVKMCKGIWLRIQYEYGLRLSKCAVVKPQTRAGAGDS